MEKSLSQPDVDFGGEGLEIDITPRLSLNQKKVIRRARELIGKNKGRWDVEEHKKYYDFIKTNSNLFLNNDRRRYDKVFMVMSKYVKTRTADQCRTHHQKLLTKFKQFSKILQVLKQEFEKIENEQSKIRMETTTTQQTQQKQMSFLLQFNSRAQDSFDYIGTLCMNSDFMISDMLELDNYDPHSYTNLSD